ncbi:MAG: arginine--tRNA ligase [Planctomycetota bacterium]
MKPIIERLDEKITAAMCLAAGRDDCSAIVRPAAEARFGDYQANGVMALAKQLGTDPRRLAEQVVEKLDVSDICQQPEIAGPGFINLRLKSEFIAQKLLDISRDTKRLCIENAASPQIVVVDFSGPNIAKQMHVGHLRSTIIGDCICRMLEFLGHDVIRQNHIGDWGTQFGMLVQHLYQQSCSKGRSINEFHITDLEDFYREAKKQFDLDPVFKKQSRNRVVELHNHTNELTMKLWEHIVDESRKHYLPIYSCLNVNLTRANECGESFYADKLSGVVKDLEKAGLAKKSDGALCVFPPGFTNKEGQPLPFIVQKSDGAYLYATTDLAALRYRVDKLNADSIIYVTDARQKLHFEMLFAAAEMAGWKKPGTKLSHVMFGSVLGEDGRPFKTRAGESVKLKDLLDESVDKAEALVEQKNPDLNSELKEKIAKAVGIGAVKYADLSNNRTSDYIFSFDRMLAMEGNTAPYMQYAYARVRSIERKAVQKQLDIKTELAQIKNVSLTEPAELDLAKHLVRYDEAILSAVAEFRPNYITAYLYDLAGRFSTFYNACPVLGADAGKRPSRVLLCDVTAETIRHGLSELLGIEVVEQM